MRVEAITVNDRQQVLLHGPKGERVMPDGVYCNDQGEMITVVGGRVSEMLTAEDLGTTEGLLALADDLADDLMVAATQLDQITRSMDEMWTTFNLQYLKLQQAMQHENRQFTTVSNIMKTKHDTAKAAINNVR